MWTLAGIGAQVLGIAAWSVARSARAPALPFWIGAGLLAASVVIFVRAMGVDLGLGWALLTVSLAAYVVVLRPLLQAPEIGHGGARTRSSSKKPQRGGGTGLALRLVSAGPLYLLAALACGAVLASRLPWAEANRLMTGGLSIPLVWALGALHATADLDLRRILGIPVLLTILFGAIILWL